MCITSEKIEKYFKISSPVMKISFAASAESWGVADLTVIL
jgi:hypothetical protein